MESNNKMAPGVSVIIPVYNDMEGLSSTVSLLIDQDFDVNAANFIISDGFDNHSVETPRTIKGLVDKAVTGEELESILTVLVGINVNDCKDKLEDFKDEANLTQFVDVGDATAQRLAKLANFVSRSISSQSQSLGTGGASQQLIF